jgi:hypothetical protein
MDEEDGRPGPRAWKFGPVDVLTDAFAGSLRNPGPAQTYPSLFSQFLPKSSAFSARSMIHSQTMYCRAFFLACTCRRRPPQCR